MKLNLGLGILASRNGIIVCDPQLFARLPYEWISNWQHLFDWYYEQISHIMTRQVKMSTRGLVKLLLGHITLVV